MDGEELWQLFRDPKFEAGQFIDEICFPALGTDATNKLPSASVYARSHTGNNASLSSLSATQTRHSLTDLKNRCIPILHRASRLRRDLHAERSSAEHAVVDEFGSHAQALRDCLVIVQQVSVSHCVIENQRQVLLQNVLDLAKSRNRLVIARKALGYVVELNQPIMLLSQSEFTQSRDTNERFAAAAVCVQNLHMHTTKLGELGEVQYPVAVERVTTMYNDTEASAVELFGKTLAKLPLEIAALQFIVRMVDEFPAARELVFSTFVDYCVAVQSDGEGDHFGQVTRIIHKSFELVHEIFRDGAKVMANFVHKVTIHILSPLVKDRLRPYTDINGQENFLIALKEIYVQSQAIEADLARYPGVLPHEVWRNLFSVQLASYAEVEMSYLRERSSAVLQQYYLNFVGMNLPDLPALSVIDNGLCPLQPSNCTTIPSIIGEFLRNRPDLFEEDKVVNSELVESLLVDFKHAYDRTSYILHGEERSTFLVDLGLAAVEFIMLIHVDYGLRIATCLLPSAEIDQEPYIGFLTIVNAVIKIQYITRMFFLSRCVDELGSGSIHATLAQAIRSGGKRLDVLCQNGIEHTLNACMSHIASQFISPVTRVAGVCSGRKDSPLEKVTAFIAKLAKLFSVNLDGYNRRKCATEFGLRVYQLVVEYVLSAKYTEEQAKLMALELSRLLDSVSLFEETRLTSLFEKLISMFRLVLVSAENISVVRSELAEVVDDFVLCTILISLRADQMPTSAKKTSA